MARIEEHCSRLTFAGAVRQRAANGSDVMSRDDQKIGEVRAVTLDPSTGRPLSFVARRGFLLAQEVEFPVDVVGAVGDGVVYVDLDTQAARAYGQSRGVVQPGRAH